MPCNNAISQVNEIQEQLVDNEHVIAATVEGMQHMMKSVDEMLGDHEGQLSALDNTQRWVVEEFNNLEMCLASVQKNRIHKDGSLKDIQASLANLEANLTLCRHDLKQQVRNKSDALHQCITNSLTGLQSSQLFLDERSTILENKANGIWTAQDKHTMLFSQALAGIHSLSQGFMTLLDHTQDIDIIQVALCDMQETMDSVKTSLEQISGDSSSDMAQSWAYPQLSLEEELCHITHGLPTLSRVVDDSKETSPEGPLQCTSGAGSAAPSSKAGKNLVAQLYCYSVAIICSVIPVYSGQPGISLTTYEWQILCIAGWKLSRTQLHALILASTMVFLVFIGFFSALRGGPLKTQEEVDWPLWYALHYGGLPSILYYLSMTLALSAWQVHQIQYTTRWLSLDNDTKAKVKQEVLVTLASSLSRAGGFFAQVIAAIASIELPHNQWPNLIDLFSVLITTLQMIGYIYFEHGGECNHIKQVMCEATQNSLVSVQVGAFKYLVKIMALYYDKMAFYMEQALFMATEYGELPEIASKLFAKIALPEVIPILLSLLTLQEEVVDEGEWNISMSVGTCFNFMAQAVTDMIVDTVIPFIKAHIKSPDGHQWEAAMMAFGSILDGPYPSILTWLWTFIQNTLINILMQMQQLLGVQSITWQLGDGIQPMAGHIMTLVLQLIQAAGKTSTVLEDALVAVGSLASDSSIDLHMPLLMLSPNSKLLPQPSTDSLNQVMEKDIKCSAIHCHDGDHWSWWCTPVTLADVPDMASI
ncbi:armadillo-type protein [Pisolithus marmoratus]|nr:armadillo-type protein [Pisolithus marmoratus]